MDCFVDKFPALRNSVIGLLSGLEGMAGFRLIGSVDVQENFLSWQVQPLESGYEYQSHGMEHKFGTVHGSRVQIREGRGLGLVLGAEQTFRSLIHLAQQRRLQGGAIYIEERLLSRLHRLELEGGMVPTCGYRLDDIVRWLEPHRGKVAGTSFDRVFRIDEVLIDVQQLMTMGRSSVSAWWWDHLDPTSLVPRDDEAVVSYFKEKYRRIISGYREVCEASLSEHLQNLGMYRALPIRWGVRVARGPDGKTFRTETAWRPVQSWSEADCDVEFMEKINFDWSDDDALISELANLGRYAGRHLRIASADLAVQFQQSNAYKASAGESVVLTEISEWLEKDIESLFREFDRAS